jgi:hypothetical protein
MASNQTVTRRVDGQPETARRAESSAADLARELAFACTVPGEEFVTAVRNIALFTGTDVTLPSLMWVGMELSELGCLTLSGTDRYVLGVSTLVLGDLGSFTTRLGHGRSVLTADAVKDISKCKVRGRGEQITVTVWADGAATVAFPGGSARTYEVPDREFPRLGCLTDSFTACEPGDVPGRTGFDPRYIARFAKVREHGMTRPPRLVLTAGKCRKDAEVSTVSRFECGPVTGLIMHWRDS